VEKDGERRRERSGESVGAEERRVRREGRLFYRRTLRRPNMRFFFSHFAGPNAVLCVRVGLYSLFYPLVYSLFTVHRWRMKWKLLSVCCPLAAGPPGGRRATGTQWTLVGPAAAAALCHSFIQRKTFLFVASLIHNIYIGLCLQSLLLNSIINVSVNMYSALFIHSEKKYTQKIQNILDCIIWSLMH